MSVKSGLEKVAANFGKVYSSFADKTMGVVKTVSGAPKTLAKTVANGTTIKPTSVINSAKAAIQPAKAAAVATTAAQGASTAANKGVATGLGHISNAYPGARKYVDIPDL